MTNYEAEYSPEDEARNSRLSTILEDPISEGYRVIPGAMPSEPDIAAIYASGIPDRDFGFEVHIHTMDGKDDLISLYHALIQGFDCIDIEPRLDLNPDRITQVSDMAQSRHFDPAAFVALGTGIDDTPIAIATWEPITPQDLANIALAHIQAEVQKLVRRN